MREISLGQGHSRSLGGAFPKAGPPLIARTDGAMFVMCIIIFHNAFYEEIHIYMKHKDINIRS